VLELTYRMEGLSVIHIYVKISGEINKIVVITEEKMSYSEQ